MENGVAFLAVLVALLVGLAAGKAWERYKLHQGRWIDRRKVRASPHYILGLNFLVAHQLDLAIEELSKAAGLDEEALEIHMILGNLYREKGQVGRAIQVHEALLRRPRLTRLEQAYIELCLGLDFKRGGFIDRALEAFSEVLRLDPNNVYALLHLEKLYEAQKQWADAYSVRQRIAALAEPGERARHDLILAFLEAEIGQQALARGDLAEARRRFEAAIELDRRAAPAYVHLGDVHVREGRVAEAVATWEQLVHVAPERAYLVFDRLERGYGTLRAPERFAELCRRLIDLTPQDWRARLALARHLSGRGASRDALELLFDALTTNPHALTVHQAIWQTLQTLGFEAGLVRRYVDLTRDAVFYLDPHVCMRCRYRSTELLWQCPQCHEWNSFVEDRIAPARDTEEAPA
jgi:lipopolysaccharide biosynthesis regulator YciM